MSDLSGGQEFPRPPSSGLTPPPPPNMSAPPGYMAYGGTNAGAFGNVRTIGGLSKAIRVLVVILIFLLALGAVALVVAKGNAQDYLDGESEDDFVSGVGLSALANGLGGLMTLALFVLTVIWMFRMAKNQQRLGRPGTWGPPWAIAGWFLPPCVLYVIPYLMMRDLWKASDPESGPDWKKNRIDPIVHIWWVLFGLVPLVFIPVTVGNLKFERDVDYRESAADVVDGFGVAVASSMVQIAAAIAFLVLVGRLSARHMQTTNER